ncbi:hypothetical protein [Kordia sp.]|uniref:hypothetical protein n=1 Tax=Kordia sp. TaxID=1965332 RepID=UPI003B5B1F4B
MKRHQLIVTKISMLFLIVTCLYSCKEIENEQSDQSLYTNEIIISLVDKFTKPIPIPPSNISTRTEKDNISSKDEFLLVGINSKMKPINITYTDRTNEVLQSIDNTIKIDNTKEYTIDIDLSNLKRKDHYKTIRYIKDREKNIFETIDILYNFSTINFNHNYTKALLVIGMSRGKLNGFTDLLVLEKINGKWKIIKRQNLQIS